MNPPRNYRNKAVGGEGMCWHCSHARRRPVSGTLECDRVGTPVALRGTCDLFENFIVQPVTEKEEVWP